MRPSPGPAPVEEGGAKVDYQVAAPAELRTPNLHRAKNRSPKSADGRMATEAARLKRQNLLIRKRKTDLTLTGLLMEGLGKSSIEIRPCFPRGNLPRRKERTMETFALFLRNLMGSWMAWAGGILRLI